MSKRFYIENGEILDSGLFLGNNQAIVDKLNELQQQLAEKEEELNNSEKKLKVSEKTNTKIMDYVVDLEAQLEDAEITRHMMCGDYTWTEMVTKLMKEIAKKEEEIEILEKSLECACSDLQSSDGAYINAIEALKGNNVILPVENAMQIEYEIALSELGIVKPENMPEKYQTKQSKDILSKTKPSSQFNNSKE